MKKAIIYFSIFSITLLSLSSCSSKKGIIQKEITKDSIVETIHDTVFSVEKDSSYYKALLECQNGNVVIKGVTGTTSGRKLKPPKVVILDNQLEVNCQAEAEELFAFWKSTFIRNYRGVSEPVITNELTWFQKTQIYIGRTAVVLVVLYLLLLLFKFKKF